MSARVAGAAVGQGRWTGALWLLGLALLGWGVLFRTEIVAAVTVWNSSAAYNHCWLVLPVAAWLAWTRRHRLAGLAPEPTAWAVLPALGAGLAWLAAERLGIMEGRQFAALGVMLSLVLAAMGWRVCRAMAAPLAYLVFLVPFGAFLVPALQRVTAWMIVLGLQLLEIPHYVDDLTIEIPAGIFLVAEACAGLRFIIASLAFGALYAFVMFRSPGRRVLVMVLALVVPVVANGLRALGIVVLGHHLGSAEAAAADHLIYGWVFFSVVILLLTLAGLPFREDAPEAPSASAPARVAATPAASAPHARPLLLAMGGTLLAALLAPGVVMALDRDAGRETLAQAAPLAPPAGCIAEGAGLLCGDTRVTADRLRFSPRATWSALVGERYRRMGDDDEALTFGLTQDDVRWHGRQSAGITTAFASWLGGVAVGDGLRTRLAQARNSLGNGGEGRPVLVVLTLRHAAGGGVDRLREDRALLQSVLAAQAADPRGLVAEAAALSR
jgi:exosortase A